MAGGLEAADDPVGQVPLLLAAELHHCPLFFEQSGQLGPAVRLIGGQVVHEHQAAVLRQVSQYLQQLAALTFPTGEQVVVRDLHHRMPAHHGQAVHRLFQPFRGALLPLGGVQVEFLQPSGEQSFLQLPQVVLPEVGLLPVKHIEVF